MFWRWDLKQVGHFGSLFGFGVALFVYNIARTLRRVPRWNVVATGISSALVWLSVGVLAGLLVAAGKCTYDSTETLARSNPLWAALKALQGAAGWVNRFDPLGVMHAHAHVGVVGFFIMMIVAVSYKLVPMFTLGELQSDARARWSIRLLNIGLAGLFLALVLHRALKMLAALVLVTGIAVYFVEITAVFRARRRRVIDWGLRYFITALGVLGMVSALGLFLSWPGLPVTMFTAQLETVYGWLGIVGVVSFTILGFLYKIVPFIVWYRRYSPLVGRTQVPALAELYSERLQVLGYWGFLAGLLLCSVGAALGNPVVVRVGAATLLGGLGVFGANLAKMLRHLWRPQLVPIVPAGTTPQRSPHEPPPARADTPWPAGSTASGAPRTARPTSS
jgi:hypothetical protein